MIRRFAFVSMIFVSLAFAGYGCFDSDKSDESAIKDQVTARAPIRKLSKDMKVRKHSANKDKAKQASAANLKNKSTKPLSKANLMGFLPGKVGNWSASGVKGETLDSYKKNLGSWAERVYKSDKGEITVKMTDTKSSTTLGSMIQSKSNEYRKIRQIMSNDVKLGNIKTVEFFMPKDGKSAMIFPIRGRIIAEVSGKNIKKIGVTSEFVRRLNMSKFSKGLKPASKVQSKKQNHANPVAPKFSDTARKRVDSKKMTTKAKPKAGISIKATNKKAPKQQKTTTKQSFKQLNKK